jgi:hypothetical protein
MPGTATNSRESRDGGGGGGGQWSASDVDGPIE